MNYAQIKKLDEDTLQVLKEGPGPADECICHVLAPPEDEPKKSLRASIKRAFGSIGGQKNRRNDGARLSTGSRQNSIEIPLTFTKEARGVYSTKQTVKRQTSCGKCGCDNEKVVLKHSYANIRITSPDVSSICPCASDCLPGKDQLKNNIKVTIEQVKVFDKDAVDSKYALYGVKDQVMPKETNMGRRDVSELVEGFWSAEESDRE